MLGHCNILLYYDKTAGWLLLKYYYITQISKLGQIVAVKYPDVTLNFRCNTLS